MDTHIQRCVHTYKVDHRVDLTLYAFGAHAHMYTLANKRLNACMLHAKGSVAHKFVRMHRPYDEHRSNSCTTLTDKYASVEPCLVLSLQHWLHISLMHNLPICKHIIFSMDCH